MYSDAHNVEKKISWNQLITQRNRKRERQYGNIIETMERERERERERETVLCTHTHTHTIRGGI